MQKDDQVAIKEDNSGKGCSKSGGQSNSSRPDVLMLLWKTEGKIGELRGRLMSKRRLREKLLLRKKDKICDVTREMMGRQRTISLVWPPSNRGAARCVEGGGAGSGVGCTVRE